MNTGLSTYWSTLLNLPFLLHILEYKKVASILLRQQLLISTEVVITADQHDDESTGRVRLAILRMNQAQKSCRMYCVY